MGPAGDSHRCSPTSPDGLTFFALHPNAPGELEAIEPDTAHIRIAEYELLRSDDVAAWLGPDVERIGMRHAPRRSEDSGHP